VERNSKKLQLEMPPRSIQGGQQEEQQRKLFKKGSNYLANQEGYEI
jgi:hypothetical protein